MTKPDDDLASGFPDADISEWRGAVAKVLRGRDFDSVLVSETRDGLEIQPLYTADSERGSGRAGPSGLAPAGFGQTLRGWDIRQAHGGEATRCNGEILEDLEGGVTSIELDVPVAEDAAAYLRAVLKGVNLDLAPVALAPHSSIDSARALLAMVNDYESPGEGEHWLGLDPLGGVARGDDSGGLDCGVSNAIDFAVDPAIDLGGVRVFTVDTTRYADAGATEAQQLAVSLSTGVAYLRACEAGGIAPTPAASMIGFRFTSTADQFVTIAMLRAARRLWSRVLAASGVGTDGRRQAQHVVTSITMLSRRDPWVNLLRSTTAALAAGVGGADSVTVLPFDLPLGNPDDLGRRTARNTQTLLIEESHVSRLVDPAGGSWFVESLTERLASMAWTGFQSIESAGGMAEVLRDGSLEADVALAWSSRLAMLATRREPLTGVSEYPLLDEVLLARTDMDRSTAGWPVRRLAEPFEMLRDVADRYLIDHGSRPRVFVAALGDLPTHTARSTWVMNFLAVAGIATSGADVDGAESPLEAAVRFSASGCDVAVICSSDAVYARRGVATALSLREAGAAAVALAGDPGDLRGDLENAGVTRFWHTGIDVLEALRQLLEHLTSAIVEVDGTTTPVQ